ncbi:MAG: hypothetical protein RLZZ561_205 [Pseudomonadota bacterium]|jgi:hypothetical protein
MSLSGAADLSQFTSFAAIDWSGQAVARPAGLALALASAGDAAPELIAPPGGWSRPAIVDWLTQLADRGSRTLIGLDLSPALPFVDQQAYFPGWAASPQNGPALWALVDHLTQEDPHLASTSFLAHPEARRHFRQSGDCGDLFGSGRGRLRVCEEVQRRMAFSPYSCFNLVGAAQVGKSSLTGMRVLHRLRGRIPVWPFDPIPKTGPMIVEIYTTIAARAAGIRPGLSKIRDGETLDTALMALDSQPHTPLTRYSDHATDAILTAAWLRRAAPNQSLWSPPGLTPEIAQTEGWTFGCI